MTTKVKAEAIKDLINSTNRNSEFTLKYLKALRHVLPMLNEGKEQRAIYLIVKALTETYSHLEEDGAIEIEITNIYKSIRELDYHFDKGKILDAAIAELADINHKIAQLEKMQPFVKEAFGNLDPRSKALLRIFWELIKVENFTNADYLNMLEMFDSEPVDIVRDDPALAPALDAFDMARDVNELLQ